MIHDVLTAPAGYSHRAGVRVVAIDGTTVSILRAHSVAQEAVAALHGTPLGGDDFVFPGANGGPLLPELIYKRFVRLARKAGLPVIRLHDLRHTHASHALAAGAPMKVVQDRLGHSSMALTADTYTHVLPEVAQQTAELVASLMEAADPLLAVREHEAGGRELSPA